MSSPSFILSTDKALTNIIWNALKTDAATQKLITSQDLITLQSPKSDLKTGKLSVFLYNITEYSPSRNLAPATVSSGLEGPQTFFSLHYLATPNTGSEENDHLLLGRILKALTENPVVLGEGNVELRISLDSLSLDDLNKLWLALGVPLRLSATFRVIPISAANHKQLENTSAIPAPAPKQHMMLDLYRSVHGAFVEQAEAWKRGNLFRRQWITQDFKKVTDMTPDEMQSALNSLGDKLQMGLPTDQFVKPLSALVEFYEHQTSELRSMERFSPKQKENVEMIQNWIKDAKALVAVLS